MTRVVHRTRYAFEEPVDPGSVVETCLSPAGATFHQLLMRPLPAQVEVTTDRFGNERRRARFDEPLTSLEVTATSVLSDAVVAAVAPDVFAPASPRVPLAGEWVGADWFDGDDVEQLVTKMRAELSFDASATAVDTPLSRFVELRRGVCQDFAHLALACLRSAGVPARFVCGYSDTSVTTGRMHAWVAIYRDGRWVDVDPTLGRIGDVGHIPVAPGRDYDDVPPMRGALPHRGRCHVSSAIAIA